ncbi:4Fe-4S single cluster domain-containing protein [Streptomyces sp. TS71-3]|uniref:4Fe-4S single cluster domain-containing protein n=1 Tax=Streptomyces sp. TS71-3 TaxID=2733862 RepID=UPI001B1E384C|nr:4Fe-4S single cluster domain-containing protein [Streptomyces sp. TS71-3]GHJ35960.1 radical SAM protein [Streptomyces sp. TS71-3]
MTRQEGRLRLHGFEPYSAANGPGTRAVVWVQGCTLGCPGCFNSGTHPRDAVEDVSADALFERIRGLGDRIEGVTISGGEPLQQRAPVLRLLERLRAETTLSTLLFTGYRRTEVDRMAEARALYACVDVLLAGRYERERHLARGLRGSANKTVHFLTDRYSPADLDAVPDAEVVIHPDGHVTFTGIDPLTPGA